MQEQQAYGMQPGMPGMMPGMATLAYAHPGMYPQLQYADPRSAYGQQYTSHALGAMGLAQAGGGAYGYPAMLSTAEAHAELAQQQQQQQQQQFQQQQQQQQQLQQQQQQL